MNTEPNSYCFNTENMELLLDRSGDREPDLDAWVNVKLDRVEDPVPVTTRFTTQDVLNLLVERNQEIHYQLDARILAVADDHETVTVALVPPGAFGEPSEAELFEVRVKRLTESENR
jgi:hypothetical protein